MNGIGWTECECYAYEARSIQDPMHTLFIRHQWKWRAIANAGWSEKVKPALGVITHIDVAQIGTFDFCSSFQVEIRDLPSFTISPHVLKWFFLCWALSFSWSAQATTILVYWTGDTIVIGADSLIGEAGVPVLGCKIIESNGIFFAFDGLTANTVVGFDSNRSTREASKSNVGLSDKVKRFDSLVRGPLIKAITLNRDRHDPAYVEWLKGDPVFQGVFAAIENSKLSLVVVQYLWTESGGLRTRIADNLINRIPIGFGFIPSGAKEGITTESAGVMIKKHGIVEAFRQMIQGQINLFPDLVGPPISILEFKRNGTTWSEHYQGKCPPIQWTKTVTKPIVNPVTKKK